MTINTPNGKLFQNLVVQIRKTSKIRDPELAAEAMIRYLSGQSWAKIAEECGCPYQKFQAWHNTEWWAGALATARRCVLEYQERKFNRIIESCQDVIYDALETGEVVYLQNGKKVKRTISAKDANAILATTFDRRQIAAGDPTEITKDITEEARIRKLKEDFQSLQTSTPIIVDNGVQDGEEVTEH